MSEAKTEEPTPRQERRARERGRAWQSRDLTLGAVLAALGVGLAAASESARDAWLAPFRWALDAAQSPSLHPDAALARSLAMAAGLALPCLVAIVVVGTATSAVQVGGLVAPGALAPDVSRLDPSARSTEGAASRAAGAALFGLARLALVLAVAIATLAQAMPGIATLSRQPPDAAFSALVTVTSALALRSGIALLFFGVLDAIVERARFRASLRMTRREKERDRRDVEGDAHVRRERDRIREALHREGDLEEARGAALVVTDETGELAIALSYDAEDPDAVPRVAAVGRSARADDLVRTADGAGIPSVRDASLADALAIVEVGMPIPERLFEPVARAMTGRG